MKLMMLCDERKWYDEKQGVMMCVQRKPQVQNLIDSLPFLASPRILNLILIVFSFGVISLLDVGAVQLPALV